MANMDMSEYLGVFLDEANEQLRLLETHILQMEQGDHSSEMLQVLFRAAHTLKGSSRAMGFTAVGNLTHQMENVLDDLRNDRQPVTTEAINLLLRCLDTLTMLIGAVASGEAADAKLEADTAALVAQLNALGASDATKPPDAGDGHLAGIPAVARETAAASLQGVPVTAYERVAVVEAIATGLTIYQIAVSLAAECLMKSVRVFMVLAALEPIGAVIASAPIEEELDAERFDDTFQLVYASERPIDTISRALATIAEIRQIDIIPTTLDAYSPAASPTCAGQPSQAAASKDGAGGVNRPTANNHGDGSAAARVNPAAAAPIAHGATIRVDVARLDGLLNLIGEMVIDRTQIDRIGLDLRSRYVSDELVERLLEATHRIARITSELQDEIMKARMLPIDGVFQRMPRMVRDLAQKTGKELELRITGGATELDRSVLEVLADPLIHLLRNSVDHGIEEPDARLAAGKPRIGVVGMAARHEENHIVIEISDDGRGIDPANIKASAVKRGSITAQAAAAMSDRDAIMLIFGSGFSTAKEVSDISGRGVGMDIVKSNLERLGGRVEVESTPGAGSRFIIHLPLTLAIVRALLVSAESGTYVLPLSSVQEMLRLGPSGEGTQLRTIGGQAVIVLRGETVPLANLADVLRGDPEATVAGRISGVAYVVIVGYGASKVGLCVDGLSGEQEVVIKSLGTMLGDIVGLAGATILADGRVALIVDIAKAVASIGRAAGSTGASRAAETGVAA